MGGTPGCQLYAGTTGAVCCRQPGAEGGTGLVLHHRTGPSPTVPITSSPGWTSREGPWLSHLCPPGRFWLQWGSGVGRSQRVLSTTRSRGAARRRGTLLLHAGLGAACGNGPPARRLSSANEQWQHPLPAAPVPALMNSPRPQ